MSPRYECRLADRDPRDVHVEERDGELHVRLGDRDVTIRVERGVAPGVWRLWFGRRPVLATARRDGDRWMLTLDGREVPVTALGERDLLARRAAAAVAATRTHEVIRAPMPGLVVALPVAVGDSVSDGAVVAILEAMKMQNEIRASAAGVVEAVHASAGDSVAKDAPLATLRLLPPEAR